VAVDEERLIAVRIFFASTVLIGHFGFDSSSDPDEDPALSAGVTSEDVLVCVLCRELG
jgi:hypothetical protein